jgi:hypothetical protein
MNKHLKEYAIVLGMVWLGCAVLLMFLFMLFVKPQLALKKDLNKQIAEKKEEYEKTCVVLGEKAQGEFEVELKNLQEKVEDYVTDSDGTANLTFDISRIASSNKVSSFSIKGRNNLEVSEVEGCKLIGQSQMDVDFESNFIQFAKFLNRLERHIPVIFINSFSIEKLEHDKDNGRVAMTLSVLVQKRQDS